MRFMVTLRLFRMSFRNLGYRKLRSFLTAFGIIIGITAVIATYSISEGLNFFIDRQVANMGSNSIFVMGQNKMGDQDIRYLKKYISNIDEISNFTSFYSSLRAGAKTTSSTRVVSIDSGYEKVFAPELEYGRFLNQNEILNGQKSIVLGADVAKTLFPARVPIGEKVIIQVGSSALELRVVGVRLKVGRWTTDNGVEITGNAARRFLGIKEKTDFVISVTNKDKVEDVLIDVRTYLAPIYKNIKLMSAAEFLRFAQTVASKLTAAGAALASLCLLVGGIGLMNIMLVSVTERKKEIGVKRALGIQKKLILNQFLIEAVSLCLVGGIIGFGLGIVSAGLISKFVLEFPAVVSIKVAFSAVMFSTFIGLLFGYAPAKVAAGLEPVEALRD